MKEKQTKIYAEVLEEEALEQFNQVMAQPWVVKGALMPDAHTGYVLPIGGVVACDNKIVPSFVGYDIGCGVVAAKLNIEKDLLDLKRLKESILDKIPIGRETHKEQQPNIKSEKTSVVEKALQNRGLKSLGTLGGGNHFIELGKGSDNKVWIVIHSGSRTVGHQVAEHYMKLAWLENQNVQEFEEDFESRNKSFKEHNPEGYEKALKKYISKQLTSVKNFEGIFPLDAESRSGKDYIKDMDFCLDYALENRKRMIDVIVKAIEEQTEVQIEMFINRNHNHAELKDGLWIHRKGATQADEGMYGVVPGNMRDGSFIVCGKGNPDSMCSSSHGAGRVLSRTKAKETLDLQEFHETMRGIETNHSDETLDEAPKAYKNIFEVMELQKEMVQIIEHVKPFMNIKG